MNIIYAQQSLPKSIFLVGPTPRSINVKSWRPEAIKILNDLGFDGTVLVPEAKMESGKSSYLDQIHWEWEGLNMATVIACWIPRDLPLMPAFTTNIEFGMYVASGKVVLGAPPKAAKMGYPKLLAERYNVPIYDTLEKTLDAAVRKTQIQFGAK